MWLTTLQGFVSVVTDKDDPQILLVRARVREDITNSFPGATVEELPGADYVYRARLPREQVAAQLAAYVRDELLYESHFKDCALAQSEPNAARLTSYYDCWSALARMQPYAPYSTVPRTVGTGWEDEE